MPYSALHVLCQVPTLTASAEKYKQLVYDSTTELLQPIQCIITALDRRALALSKCASFESALRDATVMQQLSPTSAIGYIREAMIYSEQGRQHDVIDICNQALSIVDTNNSGYVTLQRLKIDAEQRANRCVDFINQLPVDIVLTTLIPMFMKAGDRLDACKPCPYLHVSQLWRNRIVQCIGGLDFMIHRMDEENTHSQVIRFAQHTKSLYITRYTKGTWLSDLLQKNDFCSLRELSIEFFKNHHVDHFMSSLKTVSNTLTHLHLLLEDVPSQSLATMLSTCPNLTWLKFLLPGDVDLSSLPMTTWSNLTYLSIYGAHDQITLDQIIGIWKHCPSLEHLELHPCANVESTLVVNDYLPSMNHIEVVITYAFLQLTYKRRESASDEIGITHLCLSSYPEEDVISTNVIPILKQYHDTVQHLELFMNLDNGGNNSAYDVQYPQLKKLVLESSAWWIPRNAPMLEDLTLISKTIHEHTAVLDTIPANLRKLKLRLAHEPFLVDKAPLVTYLHRLSQQSQLKKLVVYFDNSKDNGTVLDAICHLGQLECLTVDSYDKWDVNQMEEFFGKLVIGCTRLRKLRINCHNAPSIQSINTLKRLGHLNKLAFSVDGINNDYSFCHSIQAIPQLKLILIYFAETANNAWIKYLYKQRPDIKVIKERFRTHY
ncbi:hypothetical protein LRAMOSA11138 [Lichtheimia ramosa]|uniref:F-box domain-containing protein n=1 Tax=Lichtheimia ramosa TaxID=688394 RepID=A0A077WVB0_9FUNG|nr:hypothetical protein LRAMOSA11138 [Lichtheimia ramosa]